MRYLEKRKKKTYKHADGFGLIRAHFCTLQFDFLSSLVSDYFPVMVVMEFVIVIRWLLIVIFSELKHACRLTFVNNLYVANLYR